jgi:hypothetical protein
MEKKPEMKRPTKGERLNWTPLSKVTPITLTPTVLQSEKIDPEKYKERKNLNPLFL